MIANALNSIYVMLQHFFFLVFEFGSVANLSTQYLVDELNNKIYKVIRCNCIGFPAPKKTELWKRNESEKKSRAQHSKIK